MRLCAVSFKKCWQDENGRWFSSGGFPLQMAAISSLFDETTLVIVRGQQSKGGIPLPEGADVVPLRKPSGKDTRRKISVITQMPYYASGIIPHVRDADVVHVPLPGDIPFLGMLTALVLRKKLIARYGGWWQSHAHMTIMNRITQGIMKACAGGRNVMLATGVADSPPAPNMCWIFSSVISEFELDQTQPSLNRGLESPPRFVYIGRLSPEKGVRYLIKAIAILLQNGFQPVPIVTIIGDGPERKELESLVKILDCDRWFKFTGQLDRTEMSKQLLRSDLCIQPSLTEGYSKAWLDAMAHGLPVIASDVGAARWVIGGEGERGWLMPPGQEDALVKKIETILVEPIDWFSVRKRCRKYVHDHTIEAWSQKIGQICASQWKWTMESGKLRP